MAKYTELFSEYLEGGGELPSSFSLIENFDNLFKLRFYDHEIGFETETLFSMKLELTASIMIPLYKERIDMLAEAITGAKNPTRTFYEKYNTTINAGEQRGQTTELPIDSMTAEPNSISHSDAYTNTDERITNREEGASINEKYYIVDKLNEKVKSLINNLLDEFNNCFMRIY